MNAANCQVCTIQVSQQNSCSEQLLLNTITSLPLQADRGMPVQNLQQLHDKRRNPLPAQEVLLHLL